MHGRSYNFLFFIETFIERICSISYIKLFVSVTQKGRSYGVSLQTGKSCLQRIEGGSKQKRIKTGINTKAIYKRGTLKIKLWA